MDKHILLTLGIFAILGGVVIGLMVLVNYLR
jgi:hypothetical protein